MANVQLPRNPNGRTFSSREKRSAEIPSGHDTAGSAQAFPPFVDPDAAKSMVIRSGATQGGSFQTGKAKCSRGRKPLSQGMRSLMVWVKGPKTLRKPFYGHPLYGNGSGPPWRGREPRQYSDTPKLRVGQSTTRPLKRGDHPPPQEGRLARNRGGSCA
jgi:hypothetical protein